MKKNNLYLLLSLTTILGVASCDKAADDNSKVEEVVSTPEEVQADIEEAYTKTISDASAKFDSAKEKGDVLPVKVSTTASSNIKVDVSALASLVDDDNKEIFEDCSALLANGVNASVSFDLLSNLDVKTYEEYAKVCAQYDEGDIDHNTQKSELTKLLNTDKTQVYAGVDALLSDNLVAFIKDHAENSEDVANLTSNTNVKFYLDKASFAAQVISGEETLFADSEDNDYSYSIMAGEFYTVVSEVLNSLKDVNTNTDVALPEEMTEVYKLLEDVKSWVDGDITSLDLVNKVEAFVIKAMASDEDDDTSEEVSVDESAEVVPTSLLSNSAKAYIAGVLDAIKALNWDKVVTYEAKTSGGVTTITCNFNLVELLKNVSAIVKVAQEKATALATSMQDATLYSMITTIAPIATSVIEAITPSKFVVTSTLTIRNGLICGISEKVDADGEINLAKLNGLLALIGGENPTVLLGSVTYTVKAEASTSYEIGGEILDVPAVPTFEETESE